MNPTTIAALTERGPLGCAAAACPGCRVCGELIKPFPRGSHCVRVYSGEEQFCYQIVGAASVDLVNVMWSDGGPWAQGTTRRSWFKGAARELADALCEERRADYELHCLTWGIDP